MVEVCGAAQATADKRGSRGSASLHVISHPSLSFALKPEGSFCEGILVVYIGGKIFGNGGFISPPIGI